jgi:nicotinate phosphoribosyltransferase
VRIDSGDLAAARAPGAAILDQGGLQAVSIFASGNLDEWRLRSLLQAGAPIDGFGVGTALSISTDAPALDAVYKLQRYAGRARRKRSEGKATWPDSKQVWRWSGPDGRIERDLVALADEAAPAGAQPLLQPVMRAGRRIAPPEPLDALREHAAAQLASLPGPLRGLDGVAAEQAYPVEISQALQQLAASLDRQPH